MADRGDERADIGGRERHDRVDARSETARSASKVVQERRKGAGSGGAFPRLKAFKFICLFNPYVTRADCDLSC